MIRVDVCRTFLQSTDTDDIRLKFSTVDERMEPQDEKDSIERRLDVVIVAAFLLSAVGAILVIWQSRFLKPKPDGGTEALLHSILLALNPGKTPVIPPVQDALPDGFFYAIMLFGTSSVIATFPMGLAISSRGPLNRPRISDARLNQLFDVYFGNLVAMLLISLTLLVCGLWQQMWYINPSVAYAIAPLTVPGIWWCLWMIGTLLRSGWRLAARS